MLKFQSFGTTPCLLLLYLTNPLHNHTHFNHILVYCDTFFDNHLFWQETPFFIITLVSSTKHFQIFFNKCDYNGEIQGNSYSFVHCNSLWQCWCCFVFKLCKLTTMNPIEKKRGNNFLLQINKYVSLPRKQKLNKINLVNLFWASLWKFDIQLLYIHVTILIQDEGIVQNLIPAPHWSLHRYVIGQPLGRDKKVILRQAGGVSLTYFILVQSRPKKK